MFYPRLLGFSSTVQRHAIILIGDSKLLVSVKAWLSRYVIPVIDLSRVCPTSHPMASITPATLIIICTMRICGN